MRVLQELPLLLPFQELHSILLFKGLILPAMGLRAIKLQHLSQSEDSAQLPSGKEAPILPASDSDSRLQPSNSLVILTSLGIRALSVDARLKGMGTRRLSLHSLHSLHSQMTMETLS